MFPNLNILTFNLIIVLFLLFFGFILFKFNKYIRLDSDIMVIDYVDLWLSGLETNPKLTKTYVRYKE